jgi:hypothetical protein
MAMVLKLGKNYLKLRLHLISIISESLGVDPVTNFVTIIFQFPKWFLWVAKLEIQCWKERL